MKSAIVIPSVNSSPQWSHPHLSSLSSFFIVSSLFIRSNFQFRSLLYSNSSSLSLHSLISFSFLSPFLPYFHRSNELIFRHFLHFTNFNTRSTLFFSPLKNTLRHNYSLSLHVFSLKIGQMWHLRSSDFVVSWCNLSLSHFSSSCFHYPFMSTESLSSLISPSHSPFESEKVFVRIRNFHLTHVIPSFFPRFDRFLSIICLHSVFWFPAEYWLPIIFNSTSLHI